ncbi:MAG: ACT domain-containing protein [Spirochaetes bacterium]|nr:ACT domain-containing protein [Spirochaetota bacterium]
MAKELNVFIDNKPGRLKAITGLLKEKKINLRALTIQVREDFGLIKTIVDKPNEAYMTISDKGFACALKEILAILIDDSPGGLDDILDIFAENNININDSYAFIIDSGNKAVYCVEVVDIEKVKALLEKNGFKLLDDQDLYGL